MRCLRDRVVQVLVERPGGAWLGDVMDGAASPRPVVLEELAVLQGQGVVSFEREGWKLTALAEAVSEVMDAPERGAGVRVWRDEFVRCREMGISEGAAVAEADWAEQEFHRTKK